MRCCLGGITTGDESCCPSLAAWERASAVSGAGVSFDFGVRGYESDVSGASDRKVDGRRSR